LGIRKGIFSGVLFGVSQFILFLIFGLLFYLGALVVRDNYSQDEFFQGVLNMFTAIYGIVFAAMTVGNNSHFLPDVGAAKNSAANLFLIIDSED
jgi:ATP-binding cassette subfamily B (MDR/TAP) protein 1